MPEGVDVSQFQGDIDPDWFKRCRTCERDLPRSAFWRDRSTRDGLCGSCKDCKRKQNAAWHQQNKRLRSDYSRAYSKANPERVAGYHRKRRYGLSQDEYQALVARQSGLCALCDQPRALVVDHDHASGRIRGLLCRPCNTALGAFGDDPQRLGRAIGYLGDLHA